MFRQPQLRLSLLLTLAVVTLVLTGLSAWASPAPAGTQISDLFADSAPAACPAMSVAETASDAALIIIPPPPGFECRVPCRCCSTTGASGCCADCDACLAGR